MIATGVGAARAVASLASRLGCQLLPVARGEEAVWAWLGGQRRIAFADIERRLSTNWPAGVSLVVGEPAKGLDGWRLTHRQAQGALLVALRRPQTLVRFADVALLAFALQDHALARSLVEIFLSPLDRERGGGAVLRKTLRAYLAVGCNASSAAAALGVARQTVENRLRTIEKGLDRLLHTCLAEMDVALRLEELGDATGTGNRLPR